MKKSLFIDEFKKKHMHNIHKVKFINEKKDRVMVLHIENLTKPLYQVFPKSLHFFRGRKISLKIEMQNS